LSPGFPELSGQGQEGPAGTRDAGGAVPMMGGEFLSQADLLDYPYLIDGDPTPAAYLLLCCADYLRLYPTGTTPYFLAL
jgi:hypothetical protein